MASSSPKAGADLAAAEEALSRRQQGPLTFTSVRGAMRWYARASERLQAPRSRQPRTLSHQGRTILAPNVDGGRGATLEDSLAIAATIQEICAEVAMRDPGRWRAFCMVVLEGWSLREAGKKLNASHMSVSNWSGWVEAQLVEPLRAAGILV